MSYPASLRKIGLFRNPITSMDSVLVFVGSLGGFTILQFLVFPRLLGRMSLTQMARMDGALNLQELLFWNSSSPPRLETMDWAKRLCAVLFGLLVPPAIQYLRPAHLWPWALAYTVYDMGVGLGFRGLMPVPMFVHHIFMAAAISVQWAAPYRHDLASMILLTELSTPFLNIRYICLLLAVDGGS